MSEANGTWALWRSDVAVSAENLHIIVPAEAVYTLINFAHFSMGVILCVTAGGLLGLLPRARAWIAKAVRWLGFAFFCAFQGAQFYNDPTVAVFVDGCKDVAFFFCGFLFAASALLSFSRGPRVIAEVRNAAL